MTYEQAEKFVAGLLAVDPNAVLFCGDVDEFWINAVEDGLDDVLGRLYVWVNYVASNCKSEMVLARFKTHKEADEFMAKLATETGIRRIDEMCT